MLKRYGRRADLEGKVTPRVLRHTSATHYLEANLDDPRGSVHILCHRSIEITMIYTQPTPANIAQRMERVG